MAGSNAPLAVENTFFPSFVDILGLSDEELDDDLLRSDEETETMSCCDESICEKKPQEPAEPYHVCPTSPIAVNQTSCRMREQREKKGDAGEVFTIAINSPVDEFQGVSGLGVGFSPRSGPHLLCSCRGQPAPQDNLTRPRSPEQVFPGQHMFDQQHSAPVLDSNPLLAGLAPTRSFQPSGFNSDPWRHTAALQESMDLSKSGSPHPGLNPPQKHGAARCESIFSVPSGPKAQKPAVPVRAVARAVPSAKPMAVARGMPVAAKQPASAKSKISAKSPPAPGIVGKNAGQRVKVEPQTPPASQKQPAKPGNAVNNEEDETLYMHCLKQQMQLRKTFIRLKEQRRRMRSVKKFPLPGFCQPVCLTRRWSSNQHHGKQPPCPLPASESQQTGLRKLTNQQLFCNPPVLKSQPEFMPLNPPQYQVLVPTLQPPWVILQRETHVPQQDQPCGDEEPTWLSKAAAVEQAERGIMGQSCGEMPDSIKITVINTRAENANLNDRGKITEDSRSEPKPKVFIRSPESSSPLSLQNSLRLTGPNPMRVSTVHLQEKASVLGTDCRPFMPDSSGLGTHSDSDQHSVNFIVRLNH